MAIKLIKGYSGNHPARNYAGTHPVAMESPCPYVQGQVFPGDVQGTLTSGAGWARVTKTSTPFSSSDFTVKLLYTGVPNITLTLTSGGTAYRAYATPTVYVGTTLVAGASSSLHMRHPPYGSYVDTRTFSVPYYRYKILFAVEQEAGAIGDWLQINWSLS